MSKNTINKSEDVKNHKKNPVKKVTKTLRKGGKKVLKTTGKVVSTTVGIVTLPITLPLACMYYAGVSEGIRIINMDD